MAGAMVVVTLGLDRVIAGLYRAMLVLGRTAVSALTALGAATLGAIAGPLVAAGTVTSGGVSAVTSAGVSVVTSAVATVVANATVTTATVAANATVTTATEAANARVTTATEAASATATTAARETRAFREVVLAQGVASARGVPPGWQAGPAMTGDRTKRHGAKGRAGRIPPTPAPTLYCRL